MIRPFLVLSLLAPLTFATIGCDGPTTTPSTAPATPILNQQSDYIHKPSGFAFPISLEGYTFASQNRYNKEGTNVSFGWNMQDGAKQMAATIYIFPAPSLISIGSPQEVIDEAKAKLFDQLWQQSAESIQKAHPSVTARPPETVTITYLGHTYTGRRQLFSYEQVFAMQRQQVTSSLYVFPFINGQWVLKYRFTYPASIDMQPAVDEFIAKVPTNALPKAPSAR